MALIKCPECGRENVSDSAEACPGCGYGIKAHFERIKQEEDEKFKKEEKDKKREADAKLAKKLSGLARKPKLYSHEE